MKAAALPEQQAHYHVLHTRRLYRLAVNTSFCSARRLRSDSELSTSIVIEIFD